MLDPVLVRDVAALLVPPGHGLPGAGDLPIVDRLAVVLTEVPTLAGPVADALAVLGAAPLTADAVATLERDRPADFAALLEAVVVAWATAPEVQRAAGAPDRTPIPLDRHLADAVLTEPVRRRGAVWRPEGRT